jgi:hypothetical protein
MDDQHGASATTLGPLDGLHQVNDATSEETTGSTDSAVSGQGERRGVGGDVDADEVVLGDTGL